jgi:hypothetical protein
MKEPTTPTLVHSDLIEDLEICCREGRQPRCDFHYRIKIDKQHYVSPVSFMLGRQLLELAGKCNPEKWHLRQKFGDGRLVKIGLDDKVDFTTPGVEKFLTLPCDQTEG